VISITRAEYEDFLNSARNPMTRKNLKKELFKNFSISYGDIVWNDYEMCFPVWNLHEGKL